MGGWRGEGGGVGDVDDVGRLGDAECALGKLIFRKVDIWPFRDVETATLSGRPMDCTYASPAAIQRLYMINVDMLPVKMAGSTTLLELPTARMRKIPATTTDTAE
jgi:hypothetical protein